MAVISDVLPRYEVSKVRRASKSLGEGSGGVNSEGEKWKTGEQDGAYRETQPGSLQGALNTWLQNPRVARSFYGELILPKVSRTSGTHCFLLSAFFPKTGSLVPKE